MGLRYDLVAGYWLLITGYLLLATGHLLSQVTFAEIVTSFTETTCDERFHEIGDVAIGYGHRR